MEAELREHGARARRAAADRSACRRPTSCRRRRRARRSSEWRERLARGARAWSPPRPPPAQGLDELASAIVAARAAAERRPTSAARRRRRHAPRLPARARRRVPRRAHRPRARSGSRASGVERLIARHDLDNEEALRYVEERLRALGVIRALEAAGFEPGDDVEIAGIVFELDPGAPFR